MAQRKKIAVVTGTRAEYGLLYWLMKDIADNKFLDLSIFVTGMHLSPEFGLTVRQMEKDGFEDFRKVEMLLSSDTPVGITKSLGLGVIGFADAFEEEKPDLLVVLGDRFEILAAVTAAMIARIPVAHLHGGEATEGLIDESIRHCITKMSHLHFTSTDEYRNRVIQLGEEPHNVFNVGACGLDNLNRLSLLSKSEFQRSINFELGDKNLLVAFHPVTLETQSSDEQIKSLLRALASQEDAKLIFTHANADTDGRIINARIDKFVSEDPVNRVSFSSLGQTLFLSALKHVDGIVGNSSSGLLEAPSFKIGTINIGDRQRGRIKADSVISCGCEESEIRDALCILASAAFQARLRKVESPYGSGPVSKKIIEILQNRNFKSLLKKQFYNIPVGNL